MNAIAASKKKFPRAAALQVAKELCDLLKPVCLPEPKSGVPMLKVCGSLRRGKAEVGDVEIVFVSRTHEVADGLFDTKTISDAELLIERLLTEGVIEKRLTVMGSPTWGPKNKLAVHRASGVPVDFFAESAANWWRGVVIRTGPKDFNLKLIAGAERNGLNLHAYGDAFTRISDGAIVPCDSELAFLEMCDCDWIEPRYRL